MQPNRNLPTLARLLSPGSILCFHGVTSAELPSHSTVNIPAEQFMRLVDVVSAVANVVSLRDILDRHLSGRSTRGMIAITFDDAYASVDALIADYLATRAVPVTLFVATSYSRSGQPFWWDRVDDLYPYVGVDRWRSFEEAVGLPQEYRRGQPVEFGPLRPLRQWILHSHLGRSSALLQDELTRLEQDCGRATKQRPMTFDELAAFCRHTGAEVATHTVSHAVLPLLSRDTARQEIAEAHRALVDSFGAAVLPALAAPFGLFSADTVAVAVEAGMRATVTIANRTLASSQEASGVPRLSMTVRTTPWRLLLHASGVREALLGGSDPATFPALPGPTT